MINFNLLIDGLAYSLQSFGGVITYWDRLIENLLQIGVNPTIILHKPNNFQLNLNLNRIKVIDSSADLKQFNLFHSTSYTLPQSSGIKQVVTIHDTIDELFPDNITNFQGHKIHLSKLQASIQECINNASHIIAISNNTKNDIIRFYDVTDKPITVIYHGLSDLFHNSHLIGDRTIQEHLNKYKIEKPFILFVGGRKKYKNFISLLKAYAYSGFYKDLDFVVVGSETFFDSDEEEIVSKFNLWNQVKLTGYLQPQELISFYRATNAFIFPSLYEGFGLPLIEAMACKSPTACSDITIFREIGGGIPIYFDPYDIDDIITSLKKLIEEDQSDRIMKGKQYSINFNWEKTVKQLLSIYKSII